MEQEVSTADFKYGLEDLINEYRTLRITAEGEELERVDRMIEACQTVDGKTLEEILCLVDTGVFNVVISAFCKRAMKDVQVPETKMEKVLMRLEELYSEAAEGIVVEELSIEVSED